MALALSSILKGPGLGVVWDPCSWESAILGDDCDRASPASFEPPAESYFLSPRALHSQPCKAVVLCHRVQACQYCRLTEYLPLTSCRELCQSSACTCLRGVQGYASHLRSRCLFCGMRNRHRSISMGLAT